MHVLSQSLRPGTDSWPDGIAFSKNGRAWLFPEQGVVFTRTLATEVDADDADALLNLFLWLTANMEPSTAVVVHDWRSLNRLSRESRAAFMARRAEITVRPSRLYVAVRLNPVYRMALQTAMLGAQMLTQAVRTELVDDPQLVLVRLGATAPNPALHQRLRESWQEFAVALRRNARAPRG